MSSRLLSILLIEDDDACALLAITVLRNAGHSVQHASTGAEAMAWFRGNRFDLVVSDHHLPDTNGLALADQMRSEEKEAGRRCTPIIGLSGSENLDQRGHGSMDVVLSKPFRVAELLALVTRYEKRGIHSDFE